MGKLKLRSQSNSIISRIDVDDLTIEDMIKLQAILTEALENGLDDTAMLEGSDKLAKLYENAIRISKAQQNSMSLMQRLWQKINAS